MKVQENNYNPHKEAAIVLKHINKVNAYSYILVTSNMKVKLCFYSPLQEDLLMNSNQCGVFLSQKPCR